MSALAIRRLPRIHAFDVRTVLKHHEPTQAWIAGGSVDGRACSIALRLTSVMSTASRCFESGDAVSVSVISRSATPARRAPSRPLHLRHVYAVCLTERKMHLRVSCILTYKNVLRPTCRNVDV